MLDAIRTAVPELAVDPAVFAAYVAARKPLELAPADWHASAHLEDLYVACACAIGVPDAVRVFHARYGAEIERAFRNTDRRGLDDAKQIVDQRLFTGAAPKIASYNGRGPLRRWLRVVAGRVLLEVVARREPLADDWELAALPATGDDPRLGFVKATYRAEYKRAFADALAQLPDRDRTVLAQYHVDGLTIDELGALYAVHRVTASRWVARAEDELRRRLLAMLRDRLRLSPDDLHSVTRLVRSQLTLSFARLR
jgi:RNA polymerase sigma-70 factor (ECF subfamily)